MSIDQHNTKPIAPDTSNEASARLDFVPEAKNEEQTDTATPVPQPETPAEAPRFSRAQKIGAGALLTVAAVFGVDKAVGGGESNTPEPEPTSTSEVIDGPVVNPVEQDVPEEAKEFVTAFGERYIDPVATFYAERDYEAANGGLVATISDEYIDSYDYDDSGVGAESQLMKFTFLYLPLDTDIRGNGQEVMVEFFNSAPVMDGLNRYMNLVAKNPSQEAVGVIKDQFIDYCGYNSPYAENLLNTLDSVVEKYGSAVNYSVVPASLDSTNPNVTLFNANGSVSIDNVGEDGQVLSFSDVIRLTVKVDVYDSEGTVSTIYESVDNVQLAIDRVAPLGPTDPGQVTIGQR